MAFHGRRDRAARAAAAFDAPPREASAAEVGTPLASPRPGNPKAMRRGRRRERIAPVARPANILEPAEIVFTPNPDLSPDDIERERERLGRGGARVRVVDPLPAPPPPSVIVEGAHPLADADDIASVTATDTVVTIVVHGPLDDDDATRQQQVDRIERLALASARHMGSPATTVEVRVIGPRA